jgi:hypothetical protein
MARRVRWTSGVRGGEPRKKRHASPLRIGCLVLVGLAAALAVLAVVFVRGVLKDLPAIATEALERRTPFRVRVGEARYAWPATVTLEGVTFRRADDSRVAVIPLIRVRCSLGELLGGRVALESLLIDRPTLTVRPGDHELLKRREGVVPDYPMQVRGLAVTVQRAGREDPWLALTEVGLTLDPQSPGCLSVEGSGTSAVGGRFAVSGVLGGDLIDSRLRVSCPRVEISPGLARLLPGDAAAGWRGLEPAGEASLDVDVTVPRGGTGPARRIDVLWRLAIRDASLRPPGFPKPITHLDARIEGTAAGLTIRQAAGEYDGALLTCRGYSVRRGNARGLNLRGSARGLRPTPQTLGLLPERARRALRDLHLEDGSLDGDLEIRLLAGPEGATLRPDFVRARLNLRGCRIRPTWFPYEVRRITGAFTADLDGVAITTPLTGWHGGGTVQVTGTYGRAGERFEGDLTIRANDLPVDEDLEHAVKATGALAARTWDAYSLEGGTLDLELKLKGPLDGSRMPVWTAELAPNGCSGTYRWFPYRLTGLAGRVNVRPGRVSLDGLTGWHGSTAVRVAGWVNTAPRPRELNVEVRGSDVRLDSDLLGALPEKWRVVWRRYGLTGQADIDVALSTPTRDGVPVDVRVTAELKNSSVSPNVGEKPLRMTEVSGRVEIFGNVCRLTGLRARCLGGRTRIEGTVIAMAGVTKVTGEVSTENVSLKKLLGLLPTETEQQVRLFRPYGTLAVQGGEFDVILRPGREPDAQYSWTVDLRDAGVSIPMLGSGERAANGAPGRLALSEMNGRLRVENRRGRPAAGWFELDKVRLGNGTIRNIVGKITRTGPVFSLDDVRGEMYGGQIEASFKGATDLLFFRSRARVSGIDVARLCRETGLTTERVWGKLRSAVYLNGERVTTQEGRPSWRLQGHGSLDIDRANLGRTPLVRSILSYKAFLLGQESVVQAAQTDFEIESRRLVIDKLVLSGPALSTRAVGTVNLARELELDLYFYRKAKGSLLPDLPVIDLVGKSLNRVIEIIQNQVVIVHVVGTLRNPRVEPAVFNDLSEQFRRYLIMNVKEQETGDEDGPFPAGDAADEAE